MYHGALFSRGRLIFTGATSALRAGDGLISQVDPVGLRFVATISVIGHWIACAVFLFEVSHHIGDETAKYLLYALLLLALVGFNGILHYRLRTNRTITWRWLQALYTWDVVLVSVWLAMSGGFGHPFIHLFYFPLLATLSVFLASFRVTMAWVTALSGVYIGISLTAGDGIDLAANDHETLLARIVVMYVVAAVVKLAGRFERMRRGQAVERELAFERERALERERMELSQAIQRERIELSHTIHDTAAQSACMIGLGIDTAKALAGNTNPELTATLEETSRLSRSTIWELRHPINLGGIYEGRELGRALRADATSFTNVSGIPAEMTQTGVEPALSIETRSLLYSMAHKRSHQRLPPCGGEQGSCPPGVQRGGQPTVGVGRRDRASRRLLGARERLREHDQHHRAPGRASRRGSERGLGRGERDLRDSAISRGGREPGWHRISGYG